MQIKERKRLGKKISVPEDLMELVLDYKFQNYISYNSQALLQLVCRGLLREKEQGNYMPKDPNKFSKETAFPLINKK